MEFWHQFPAKNVIGLSLFAIIPLFIILHKPSSPTPKLPTQYIVKTDPIFQAKPSPSSKPLSPLCMHPKRVVKTEPMVLKPKLLDEFLGQTPNLLVFEGYVISYKRKTSQNQPDGPRDGALGLVCIPLPTTCASQRLELS